jgi:hypothetical protein
MKNKLAIFLVVVGAITLDYQTVSAQFPIKIPKIKVEKPKTEAPNPDSSRPTDSPTSASPVSTSSTSQSRRQYGFIRPDARPLLVWDSIYIQAATHDAYWKMPGQKYSSWVPTVRFTVFYDWKVTLNYVAEYFNPDGSLWFSEPLEGGRPSADDTVMFKGDYSNMSRMRDTKSSAATGLYGIKITNKTSGEVAFLGKFKVGKFPREYRGKNEFEFYVDHDWIMPIGTVSFHHSNFSGQDLGFNFPVQVSIWFKQNPGSDSGLEARLYYKGQQIATTNRLEPYEDRASEVGNLSAELHHWNRLQFEWFNEKVNVDNGGSYHPDNMPKSFFVDRNAGEYTVKVYQKGVQVREAKFTVGTDGRVVDGGYQKPGNLTYHKVLIPVTVIGASEKWNSIAWKAEAFYGNPLNGFVVP